MKKLLQEFWGYTALFTLTCLPALIGRLASYQTNKVWYAALNKPFFVPPSWIFPIVWPVLYFFMATAAWMIWRRHQDFFAKPLIWYYLQLGANALWSPIFFGAHLLFSTMIWSYILFALVTITTNSFLKADRAAGSLLIPYTLWCGFAALLSSSIWFMN